MLDLIKSTDFLPIDIINFIIRNGGERFETISYFYENFKIYINKIFNLNQIMVFHSGNELRGVCTWCLIHEKDKYGINKIRWTFPEDIETGEILYISSCVLLKGCSIFKIKNLFEKMEYRKRIKEVSWFTKNKFIKLEVVNESLELRPTSSG